MISVNRILAVGCALLLSMGAADDGLVALEHDLAAAIRAWDVASVEEVLTRVRSHRSGAGSLAAVELQVRAGLALAELLRVDFEDTPKADRSRRTLLGQRIDVAAGEGLVNLARLPESSERFRIEADLLATMIRSDYRAKKYRRDLEAATERALELDAGNPRAWVTAAKPLVFAGPKRGGDLDEAVRLLDQALELEPGLESALLLRALVWERRGDQERATADWQAALDANPQCRPASARVDGAP